MHPISSMAVIRKEDNAQASRQNVTYYNSIAAEYDAILDKDEANAVIRAKMADTFTRLVHKNSRVLDFGGGTGQDLGWLLSSPYSVLFCEPSADMRSVAMERSKQAFPAAGISFLNDGSADFRNWQTGVPTGTQVDGVLANFAVFNCIPDIELLFEKLAMVLKPGGTVLALILDNSLKKRFQYSIKGTLQSFFNRRPLNIIINHNGRQQLVYIHSNRSIKKALGHYFSCKQITPLQGLGFSICQLEKK